MVHVVQAFSFVIFFLHVSISFDFFHSVKMEPRFSSEALLNRPRCTCVKGNHDRSYGEGLWVC